MSTFMSTLVRTRLRTRLRPWAAAFFFVVLSGCSTFVRPPAVAAPAAAQANAAWARVLSEFVNDQGEVDFPALAAKRGDLDAYVSFVAETPLERFAEAPPHRMTVGAGQDERLAHMINAYNALAMFNVLESGIPKTHAGLHKVTFFALRDLTVGGRTLSLYKFENDVIRPYTRSRADPRVHFALNCSAVSCPVLPRLPFTAVDLDRQLEAETRAFFAKPENFRIDAASRTVWLSEILKFYAEDFVPVPAKSLVAYAQLYGPSGAAAADLSGYTVRFTPYDWTIANSRRVR